MQDCEHELDDFVFSAVATASHLRREEIGAQTSLWDLGVDSISLTAIVARIEARFGCEFTPEQVADLLQIDLVGELVDCVARVVAAHTGGRRRAESSAT